MSVEDPARRLSGESEEASTLINGLTITEGNGVSVAKKSDDLEEFFLIFDQKTNTGMTIALSRLFEFLKELKQDMPP